MGAVSGEEALKGCIFHSAGPARAATAHGFWMIDRVKSCGLLILSQQGFGRKHERGNPVRKSNVLIIAILVVASIAFLWLWNYLRFNLVHGLDLVITIVWWVVIVALCLAIHYVEQKRRERMRTVFISDGALYNSEAGVVSLDSDDPATCVETIRSLLSNLNYDADAKVDSNQTRMRFKYIVHSPKFADEGDTWRGDVVHVTGSHDPISFDDARGLLRILENNAKA